MIKDQTRNPKNNPVKRGEKVHLGTEGERKWFTRKPSKNLRNWRHPQLERESDCT